MNVPGLTRTTNKKKRGARTEIKTLTLKTAS